MTDFDVVRSMLAGFAANVLVGVGIGLTLRRFRTIPPVKVFAVGIAAAIPTAWLIGVYVTEQLHPWHAAAVVAAAGVIHFFAFAAVFKAVSLRILDRLFEQPDGVMTTEALVEDVVRPVVLGRMNLLVEMGFVTVDACGRFRTTERGRSMVRRLKTLQAVFGVRTSGLYRPDPAPAKVPTRQRYR
jgi:hypothetical protein